MFNTYETIVLLVICVVLPGLFICCLYIHHLAIYLHAKRLRLIENKEMDVIFLAHLLITPVGASLWVALIGPMETSIFILTFSVIYWGLVLFIQTVLVFLISSEGLRVKKKTAKEVWNRSSLYE